MRAMLLAAAVAAAPLGALGSDCPADTGLIETATGEPAAFALEIVDTPETRAQGLMFRTDLTADQGMLFLFDDVAPRTFWMMNTPLSLDMLFFDGEGVLCGLIERAEPHTLDPRPSGCGALAVLEVLGGQAEARGIEIGARMRHPAFGSDAAWPCGVDEPPAAR
jgi:uncharacterized membrane protein (UPF0127 family)